MYVLFKNIAFFANVMLVCRGVALLISFDYFFDGLKPPDHFLWDLYAPKSRENWQVNLRAFPDLAERFSVFWSEKTGLRDSVKHWMGGWSIYLHENQNNQPLMKKQAPWILWININGVGMFTYICLILMVNVGKYTGAIWVFAFLLGRIWHPMSASKNRDCHGVSKAVGSLIFLLWFSYDSLRFCEVFLTNPKGCLSFTPRLGHSAGLHLTN